MRSMIMRTGIAALSCLLAAPGLAQESTLERRQYGVDYVLHQAARENVAVHRASCATGAEVNYIEWIRAEEWGVAPDPIDGCLAALTRIGREATLLEYYRELTTRVAGEDDGYEQVPAAIGTAIQSGQDRVAISQGRGVVIPPALALDAGFTIAFRAHAELSAQFPSMDALRPTAAACLAGTETRLNVCFSVGHVIGARVARGEVAHAF